MRLYSTRMNDSEYIEYLEQVILELENDIEMEKKKFNDYIARQHKEQMANIGVVLKAAANAIEKRENG